MLDVELHRQDIQDLHNADAVAAFFAKLRYDTNARLTQKPANLGIVESLHSQIRHCERIADQENLLQLYLFELTSVTVATTKTLARAFKNLSGDFLLVLTSDYERLDFVFLERMLPEVAQLIHPGHPKALRQTIQRPRVLTVERRNPDPVSLRVLRRFTYTEADPFGQVEKLKSAFSVADWSEEEFNNRALFADYYLKERLPDYAEWKEDAKPLFNTLSDLYERARERWGGKPEKVLRDECLKPTLEDLGFKLEEGKPAGDPSKKPDFVLYSPSNDSIPIAYCLAYRWDRFLDGKDAKDTETPDENPGSVVVTLLEREDVNWVIVTNGKLWRLYSSKADSVASNYYEIDLEETLVTREADLFRYFWLLFRAESFVPKEREIDGEVKTLSFLDRLIDGSADYAKRLGDKLKDLIFEEIFIHLARGFIAYQRSQPGLDELPQRKLLDVDAQLGLKLTVDQPWMDRVYQATLTFLYRLLFLLYAEARDLLPVKSQRGYFEKSLTKMKREIAEKAGEEPDSAEAKTEKAYSKKPEKTELYDRFMELCRIIDEGDASIDLPMYNGGLFLMSPEADDPTPEAESSRLLNQLKMPDAYLALALDLLARTVDEKTHNRVFIDYKSLGVRQLGSIYEGLLEFHLREAKEKLAICRDSKRKEFYMPYREATKGRGVTILKEDRGRNAKERTLPKKAIYLENNKHERKATGSYYTPEYIVKYIVEHTVGPVLEEKFQKLTPALRDAEKLYHKKRKYKAEAPDLADDPEKVALVPEVRKATEELFDVKVLDPAMGSGHFLVEAVDFIADKMLHFLNGFSWTPVLAELEETKQTILEQMQEKKISIDPARLTNVNLLKRHILKRCIYGVDLNPMAVELAKVSLWLHCFTLGAPLSFLDHHLKCGNSLIGADSEEAQKAVEEEKQLALWGSLFAGRMLATDLMRRVGELSDVTAAQVRESRVEYCKAYDALGPFRRILDLYTSQWFGNDGEEVLEFLRTKEAEAWVHNPQVASAKLDDDQKVLVIKANEATRQHRLFHWDLAFPEVFFGPREGTTQVIEKKENPGFDAVVGNPPYDVLATKELGFNVGPLINYFSSTNSFRPAVRGKNNLYKVFICQAIGLARRNGIFGFIVPMALLGDDQSLGVRTFLLEKTNLIGIEVFPQKDDPHRRVFPDSKLATTVFLTKCNGKDAPFLVRTHDGRYIEESSPSFRTNPSNIRAFDPENLAISSCSQEDWDLATRLITQQGIERLGKYAESFQGEVNETNEKKRKSISRDINHPLILRGASVCMYAVREASQGEELHLDVKTFLKGKGKNTKAYSHNFKRVGFQRSSPQNNFRRIIAAPIDRGNFCFDTVSYVTEASTTLDLDVLLTILNSKVLDWYFRLGSSGSKVNEYQFNNLPIPKAQEESKEKDQHKIERIVKSVEKANYDEALSYIDEGELTQGMPKWVNSILANCSRKIQDIEAKRILSSRTERSRLAKEAEPIQRFVDRVLYKCYGISEVEAQGLEERLQKML